VPLLSRCKRLLARPHLRLIALVGVIVPRRLRADWRQEWEAELRYREELLAGWDRLGWRGKLDLLWRSTSAFWDALWLQPKRWEDEMFQDLRYGVRMLAKSRAFTIVAILTLAFGIGANTAIFSVVYAVLLSPLPYPQAERIVAVGGWMKKSGAQRRLSGPEFVELGRQNRVLDHWSTFEMREFMFTLTGGDAPVQVKGQRISQELLPLFGVSPLPGRAFSTEEFQPGHDQVVLISHRLWQRRWAADPNLIGQAVTLQQKSYTVIGIIPPGFNFFPDTDVFVPAAFDAERLNNPIPFIFPTLARLKPGVTIEHAERELSAIESRFNNNNDAEIRLYPLREIMIHDYRPRLFLLWGVVGCVLLIACANFANLLLARAANRQKEIAIRVAVGARRGRIVRQLLTESVLLAILGGAAGLLFAHFGVDALLAAGPVKLPHPHPNAIPGALQQFGEVGINGWVIAFTFGISLLTGVIFGLAPALKLSKPDMNGFLKEGAAVSGAGFRFWRHQRLQSLLVVAEIALALVLLVGAGLLVRNFWRLQEVTPGFQAEKLLTIQLQFPWYRFREHSQVVSLVGRMTEYLEGLPGVQSASATSSLPLIGRDNIRGGMIAEDEAYLNIPPGLDGPPVDSKDPPPPPPPRRPGDPVRILLWSRRVNIGPRYFETMRIPVKQGREFNRFDNEQSIPVAVINETMARRYWLGKDPIGKRIKLGPSNYLPWITIVGIVGDSMQYAQEGKTLPALYLPLLQSSRRGTDYKLSEAILREVDYVGLVVRTTLRPEDLKNAAQAQVRSLDPDQPALRVATMEELLTKAVELPRFNMLLFGVFAGVALLLSVVGIYGLMAYLVTQRTHEIGIRIALGAQKSDVLWLAMSHGMKLIGLGMVIGLAAALALTRLIQNWLFGISATDPLTFAGIVALLAGVALLACYLPARRAMKVDPLVALRHE
jgi:putative ABC transport system permease protein